MRLEQTVYTRIDRKELTHGLVQRPQQNNEDPIQWEISHKARAILSTGGGPDGLWDQAWEDKK